MRYPKGDDAGLLATHRGYLCVGNPADFMLETRNTLTDLVRRMERQEKAIERLSGETAEIRRRLTELEVAR